MTSQEPTETVPPFIARAIFLLLPALLRQRRRLRHSSSQLMLRPGGIARGRKLASTAGHASGSAARSMLGGFVELHNTAEDIALTSLIGGDEWPLEVVVAITASGPKSVGSTEAMELSRRTSPFYERWIEQQDADLDEARAAIAGKDFARLASVAEHNCLKMHSVMWGSRPPMVYWNATTLACMEAIRDLQSAGVAVFFTIDAGPQLKAVC